jgi:hypothetical protein
MPASWKENLRDTLRALASDYDGQVRYLRSTGMTSGLRFDELALELDEALQILSVPEYAHLVDKAVIDAASIVDRKFEQMSQPGEPDHWSPDAARTSSEWEQIRRLARQAVELMELKHPSAPIT